MSLKEQENEQAFLRDDINQLAYHTQTNNFNVRKYYQAHNTRRNQTIRIKCKNNSQQRVHTQPIDNIAYKMKSLTQQVSAIDRVMVKVQPDFKKRAGLTGSLKFTEHKSKSYSKSKIDTCDEIEEYQKNRYKEIEKKTHKGPLRKKIIQTWLNTILTETAQIEVVDQTIANAALKKFQIDQNSLMSRGIKPKNIQRIYQSLFVHSIGFNNNLKQIVEGHTEAQKNIWRVFSILLEYCAQGKFETMVGIIERQKIIKVEELREEIAKRQEIIEKNDELNENRNIEIFREIKNLKAQNINLSNQKQILYQDFQKTEQAFNEQVALRLKFENKINELFGVHRQLGIKHQRLYDDYKKKLAQCNSVNQKNTQLNQLNWQLKNNVNDLSSEKQRLQKSVKYNTEYIMSLKDEKVKLKDSCNFYKHEYDEQRRMTKQLQRRLTQCEIQIKNLSEIVIIKDKSWKQTHSEYQLSLQENNRLFHVINEQRAHLEELLFEKKEFNNKILSIVAEASFEKKKRQQFSTLYHETDKKLIMAIQKCESKETDNLVKTKRIQSLEHDAKENYENIHKMHQKNQQLEEQLHYLRSYKQSLSPFLQGKQKKLQQFMQKYTKKSQQYQDILSNFKHLQSKLKTTQQTLENEIEVLKANLQKLLKQREQLESTGSQQANLIIRARKQTEKYMKLFQDTTLSLKNQKFQRSSLKVNYEQSLTIIDKKNKAQKEMGIEISELKDKINTLEHQKDKVQLNLQNETYRKENAIMQMKQTIQEMKLFKQKNAGSVHMMVFEDLAENYHILRAKKEELEQIIKIKDDQYQNMTMSYKNKIKALQQSHSQYLQKYKKQKQKQIFQKQSQIEYEKDKSERMQSRLKQLQEVSQTYLKKIQERTTSQRQNMYKTIIEEKSKSIDELLKKNLLSSQKCEKMKEELVKNQQKFAEDVSRLKKIYKQENQKLSQQIIDLKFDIQHEKKQNERLHKQMEESDALMQEKIKQRIKVFQLHAETMKIESKQSLMDSESISEVEQKIKMRKTGGKWGMMKKLQEKNPQIKKRNEISRKMQLTYTYYKG